MIKTFKKCLYSDASRIVCFDENDKFLCKTESKSSHRLRKWLMKLTNKFLYADITDYQVCMNNNLIFKSWQIEKWNVFAILFENEYIGDWQFCFTS